MIDGLMKEVKKHNNYAGRVYLPRKWEGLQVLIIPLKPNVWKDSEKIRRVLNEH